MPRLPDSLQLLHRRDFRLLFGAQAVSLLGDRMVNIALAFAVLELGGSASDVGLVLTARAITMVASLLVGGVVADRTSRRAVMVIADLVRLAGQGAIALLLIAGSAEIWMLAVLSGVSGAATGFFYPASTGLLPAVVPPADLQRANGLRATAQATGEIAGPALAGVLVAAAGPGWALGVDAATFGVSAAFLAGLRLPPRAERAPASFLGDLREGWREFRSRTWLWAAVVSVAFGNMLWGAWNVLGPVVADRDLGGAATWGTVLAAMGVGGLAGGVMAIRLQPERPLRAAAFAYALFSVPLGLLAAGAPVPLLAVGTFLAGFGLMFGNSVWESALQRLIPAEALSRVAAFDWFGALAFTPFGFAIWGPIAVAVGIHEALWLAFVLQAISALALIAIPDVRRLRVEPAEVALAAEAAQPGARPRARG